MMIIFRHAFVSGIASLIALLVAACGAGSNDQNKEIATETELFTEVAEQVGLDFRHHNGRQGEFYFPEPVGSGAALLDFDNDGDLDVYVIQGGDLTRNEQVLTNRLFENLLVPDGTLRFRDITDASGLGDDGYGMGVATGDIDNDGWVDLYVTNFGANRLFRNLGNGRFEDITPDCACDDAAWSTSAAFLDYDRDGDLDLFVSNYVDFSPDFNKACKGIGGRRDYCGPQVFEPTFDRLFENTGDGRFRDVGLPTGIGLHAGPGLGVLCADFNNDQWPDIYVANDQSDNHLFINSNGERFVESALAAGSAVNALGMPEASMGVAAADFDQDGDEDLFMTHLASQTNTLYINDGQGGFQDGTSRVGLGVPSLPMTGFGTGWFDIENDGLLDLFSANGAVMAVKSRIALSDYPYEQQNQLFQQQEIGRFQDISNTSGDALMAEEISRGAAFGDIDNDGDTDILVTNNDGPLRLLVNQADRRNSWVALQLEGGPSNRSAYGARIGVTVGGKTYWRRVGTDGSYLSASDPRVLLGLGSESAIENVTVVWPSGMLENFQHIESRQLHRLVEGQGE